jgi:hypothetical protein
VNIGKFEESSEEREKKKGGLGLGNILTMQPAKTYNYCAFIIERTQQQFGNIHSRRIY